MTTASTATDHAAWLRRWDAQQARHVPDREERFTAIIDAVAAGAGARPRVLDLGCGPGSLSARLTARLPEADVVAVDTDPVLLEIGRGALGDRVTFIDADLRGDWRAALPHAGPFDAAVSTTALHWLPIDELLRLYQTLATLLREGGVFCNGDRLDYGHDQRRIAAIARTLRDAQVEPQDAEDYDAWWAAAVAEPAFATAAEERRRRAHDHPDHHHGHTYAFHRAALLAAGFSEAGTVWQRLSNRVLLAVR